MSKWLPEEDSVTPVEAFCLCLLHLPYRLVKNTHLRRFPYPSSLRRTAEYASLLRISGALHLGVFEQPEEPIPS